MWASDLSSTDEEDWFARVDEVAPVEGKVTVTLEPDHVYTLSTTTGQAKGSAVSPADETLGLPWRADLSREHLGQSPPYFNDIAGTFEVARCRGAVTCLRQQVPEQTIWWGRFFLPLTVVGDHRWEDYTVTTRARLVDADWVEVMGRTQQPGRSRVEFGVLAVRGYHLRLAADGQWLLTKTTADDSTTTLASGTHGVKPGDLAELRLTFTGDRISASLDDDELAVVTDSEYGQGRVGLQVAGFDGAEFTQLDVVSETPQEGT